MSRRRPMYAPSCREMRLGPRRVVHGALAVLLGSLLWFAGPGRADAQYRCGPGTVASRGACVPAGQCPAGTLYSRGQCVRAQCPAGTAWNGAGCVRNATYGADLGGEGQVTTYQHPTWGLFAGGLIGFGVIYIVNFSVTIALDYAADGEDDVVGLSFIPIAGPILVVTDSSFGAGAGAVAGLIASTVLQTAGLTLAVLGLVIQSSSPAYVVEGGHEQPSVQLTPLAGFDEGGPTLGLSMTLTHL